MYVAIYVLYCIAGFFKQENFHEFHKSIVICENFTLKIFPKELPVISNVLKLANGQVQGLKYH